LTERVPGASLSCDAGSEDDWEQLVLSNTEGVECVVVERNPVADSESLGFEELQEFREEIQSCQPRSAVDWLNEYFGGIRAIYAFQVLGAADEGDGWRALEAVKLALWRRLGGIFQADQEGFSNEDGYHILWQFSDRVSGDWWMAVRTDSG
jgi:hypothetical protein